MAYSLELGRSKPIMVEILKDNFKGVFMGKTNTNPVLGSVLNMETILDSNTDARPGSVKELVPEISYPDGLKFNNIIYKNIDEKKLLTFYLTLGEAADKLVYFKKVGEDQYKVTGIQTFQRIQSDVDKPVFVSSLRINLIDGQ